MVCSPGWARVGSYGGVRSGGWVCGVRRAASQWKRSLRWDIGASIPDTWNANTQFCFTDAAVLRDWPCGCLPGKSSRSEVLRSTQSRYIHALPSGVLNDRHSSGLLFDFLCLASPSLFTIMKWLRLGEDVSVSRPKLMALCAIK